MKKRFTLIALAAFALTATQAKVLSPEAAWQRAKTPEKGAPALAPSISGPVLARTLEKDGDPTVYVFNTNNGQGFCVVSADDLASPVLGYSDNGGFDPSNMPPSLKSWLNEYSRIIAYARANDIKVSGAPAVPSLASIQPMVKTKWNQDAPYNEQCPKLNGKATYTGCVATAMAQVLKTYSYPAKGKGRRTYQWMNNNNQSISMDFSKITFDWANMTDTYNSSSTETQKKAVSTLMMACGYAAQMNYGTNASGAQTLDAGQGLVQNFDYDRALKFEQRDYYGIVDWMKLLHGELSLGRPVLYTGVTENNEGHAFVLDGYDSSNGFVHINWGWGGMSDGYFEITTLDPGSQGIGGAGSGAGFAYGQCCFSGLQKPVDGHNYLPNMALGGNFCTKAETYSRNSNVSFLSGQSNEGIYSYAIVSMSYRIGIKLVASNGTTSYVWATTGESSLQPLYGYNSVTIPASSFPTSGEYTATMAFQSGSTIGDVPAPMGYVRKLKLTCSPSQLKFEPVYDAVDIKATAPEALSDLYLDRNAAFKTTVSNTGAEYYGPVFIAFTPTGSEELLDYLQGPVIDIIAGQSQDLEFMAEVPSEGINAGNYRMAVYALDGTRISDFTAVTVKNAPTGTTYLRVDNVRVTNSDGGDGTQANPFLVYTDSFNADATLNCSRGFFDGQLNLFFFGMGGGTSIAYLPTKSYPVGAGSSTPITASGALSGLSVGSTYFMGYYNGQNLVSSGYYYLKVVGTTSGVDDINDEYSSCEIDPNPVDGVMSIKAGSAIRSASVYSLSGMLVREFGFSGISDHENAEVGDLARGHYIVRIVLSNGQSLTRRMMKR